MGVEMAAIAVAGTAWSMYQNEQAAGAMADAERQMQGALNAQAGEVERRGSINRAIMEREGEQFISRQSTAFSANGVDVASSTGALDFLANERSALSRRIELQRQETAYQAAQTRAGINASNSRIDSYRNQANSRNIGSLLNLGGSMYSTYGGGTGNTGGSGGMNVGPGISSAGSSYSGAGNIA